MNKILLALLYNIDELVEKQEIQTTLLKSVYEDLKDIDDQISSHYD